MTRFWKPVLAVLCCIGPGEPVNSQPLECSDRGDPASIRQIELQRERFNTAIAEQDIDAIRAVLDPDAILVSGSDSIIFDDRQAQLAIWERDFGSELRNVYIRKTGCVRISADAPVATEFGTWRGEPSQSTANRDFASGSFAAKWRRNGGVWQIEAEIFATEHCSGIFCPAD